MCGMNSQNRHIGATIAVALLLVTAGCLGFGGGSDPAPDNETPDMDNGSDPVDENNTDTNGTTNTSGDDLLNTSMTFDEITERSSLDMLESSPYAYTMESESTTTIPTSPETVVSNSKSFDATVNDYDGETYILFTETARVDLPDRTEEDTQEGIFFGAPNINATKYDSSDEWQYGQRYANYENPYAIVQQNMDSPSITEDGNTIVLTETVDSFAYQGAMANSLENVPVEEIDTDETTVEVTIRNEQNETHVVEEITLTRSVSGTATTPSGDQDSFESEMETTVTYDYENVEEIEPPSQFTEENSTDN